MEGLGRKALASPGTATCEDFAAAHGRHALTEPMTALAHQIAGLKSAFHLINSALMASPLKRGI
jgi:hypothetical protein